MLYLVAVLLLSATFSATVEARQCLSDGSHCRSSDPAMAGFDMGTCCSGSCVEHADHPGDYFCAAAPAAAPASRKGWSLF